MSRQTRIWSRREIKGMIADGRKIVILGDLVLKVDAWLPYHPGGDKSILHMVGRDATDEITALHSEEAQAYMRRYAIGKIQGSWENLLPPIQGGKYKRLEKEDEAGEREEENNDDNDDDTNTEDSSSGKRTPASSVFDGPDRPMRSTTPHSVSSADSELFTSKEASAAHAISCDLSRYPRLDQHTQEEVAAKYRALDDKLHEVGLYQCRYSNYGIECIRYAIIFGFFWFFFQRSYFAVSAFFLGWLWHLLSFVVHDAGHLSITHNYHVDSCIGIFIADFLGGLSVGWWKRNHNVHHIVTNAPEHDPDIQHMPFFAITSDFFSSLFSSYYNRVMKLDAAAYFFIKRQHYLYYPILAFGRFNLYRLAWMYLLDPAQAPRKGPAWWHRYLEMIGQVVFWYWYGYRLLYLSIPTWSSRLAFLVITHMVTGPLHVQLTLSHFAMSTADLGVHESFAQKMLRTTMDVDCPTWIDFVHGGLQFQVVHHMFPRLPRHNLRAAQKYVKEFCSDLGIPYVIYSFTRGNQEIISRLGEVAEQLRVLDECRKVAARDMVQGHHR